MGPKEESNDSPKDEKKLTGYFATRTCKVPQLTWQFWVIKSGATTVGETVSDYFNVNLGLGLGGAAALFYPLLLLILIIQLYLPRYVPYVYWLGVILLSICGTIFTDGLHDNLGVELWIENIVFFVLMCTCFGIWYYVEGTLDFHSINTLRRESFYWLTILFTFSLGTAIGDGISEAAMFGYGATFGLFVGAIIMFGLIWYFKLVDDVTGFWLCYIMTRPLGAACGDLMSVQGPNLYTHITPIVSDQNITSPVFQPTSRPTMLYQMGGGANLGYGYTSLIFISIIFVLTTWMTITGLDQLDLDENGQVIVKSTTTTDGVDYVNVNQKKISPNASLHVEMTPQAKGENEVTEV